MKEKPNRISELRRKSKMSQEKLAEILNVTQASVSLYENSGSVPLDILVEISRYFNVTIDYLLKLPYNERATTNISENEYCLLLFYRGLPPKYRRVVDRAIKSLSA